MTDSKDHQKNLNQMINRLKSSFSKDIEIVNLRDLNIVGSCIGCIQCGYDNRCRYEGKDDFIDFFNSKIKTADILIWAGKIKDRYFSSRWKLFFDRSFFTNHVPSLIGKQIAFIVEGPLGQIPNLRQILEGYVEMQGANLAGFVTDEYGDSNRIDEQLDNLADRLIRYAQAGYIKPGTFLSAGGRKIFRDEIWGKLRFPFRADYAAYKKLGFFDFPQKRYGLRVSNTIKLLLSRLPAFRKEVNKRMIKEMIKPLQKVLE